MKNPQEYLWTHKIWKYGKERNILILNDGKVGHLRQAQAVAKTVSAYLKGKNIDSNLVDTIEVKFRNNFAKTALTLSGCLAGKYHC